VRAHRLLLKRNFLFGDNCRFGNKVRFGNNFLLNNYIMPPIDHLQHMLAKAMCSPLRVLVREHEFGKWSERKSFVVSRNELLFLLHMASKEVERDPCIVMDRIDIVPKETAIPSECVPKEDLDRTFDPYHDEIEN